MTGRPRKYATIEELDKKFDDLQDNHITTLQKAVNSNRDKISSLRTQIAVVKAMIGIVGTLVVAILVELLCA